MTQNPEDYFDWSKELSTNEDKNIMLELLGSSRFWGVVITSASVTLTSPTFITDPWYVSLGKFLGYVAAGATAIRSWDRNSDKALEGSKIQAGQSVEESK